MNGMLPKMQSGYDMNTMDMALADRAEAYHAPDVPQVTEDMNPYYIETGVPPMHEPAETPGMETGEMGMPDDGMLGGGVPEEGGMQSPDDASMMSEALMQRMQQDDANAEQFQGQAQQENQQQAMQRKKMGI